MFNETSTYGHGHLKLVIDNWSQWKCIQLDSPDIC